jgi:hypothetical protein
MPSIAERLQGLMPTIWSSRSTTTDASPANSPSLGVAANEASTILSMSPTDAQEVSTSSPSSPTGSAPNPGSTTFTERLRNIFISVREKCSSAFTTIRTSIASAFTKVVTWVSNLRPGNRDQAEPVESPTGGASSNSLTDPNPKQPADATLEEDQRTPSANLLAQEEEVAQMGLQSEIGDVLDSEVQSDENESLEGSEDASLEEKVDDVLFQSCISHSLEPVVLAEAEPVITEESSPAAAQLAVDELLADARASFDAIETIAGGMVTFPAPEASFFALTQADQASQLPQTVAEHSGRRSPSSPLFTDDQEEVVSPNRFPRRASFGDVGALFEAPEGERAGAGRPRSLNVELTPTPSNKAEKPSAKAATSPSKGKGKHKAGKR